MLLVTIVVNSGRSGRYSGGAERSGTHLRRTCVAARFRVVAERRGLRSSFSRRYFEALVVLSGFGGSVLCCFFCFVLPRERERGREGGRERGLCVASSALFCVAKKPSISDLT